MWHVGIDLHRQTLVIAAVDDAGNSLGARRIDCRDREAIVQAMRSLEPFRAVIEATGTYRWLYDLLAPLGTVLLAQSIAATRHGTAPQQDRQTRQPIAGQPAADQSDPAGLHSPAELPTTAGRHAASCPFVTPGGHGQDSTAKPTGSIHNLVLLPSVRVGVARVPLVCASKNSAPSAIGSATSCCCGWSTIVVNSHCLTTLGGIAHHRFLRWRRSLTSPASGYIRHC